MSFCGAAVVNLTDGGCHGVDLERCRHLSCSSETDGLALMAMPMQTFFQPFGAMTFGWHGCARRRLPWHGFVGIILCDGGCHGVDLVRCRHFSSSDETGGLALTRMPMQTHRRCSYTNKTDVIGDASWAILQAAYGTAVVNPSCISWSVAMDSLSNGKPIATQSELSSNSVVAGHRRH